ncbi:MAG: peptidylprolyl isomerase [Lachnospiraceae bacterium]
MQEDLNLSAGEMLTEVNKAIYAICVGGQSYKIGSRQLTRADLNTLYKIKNDLMAQVNAGNSSLLDDCYVAVFDRR